MKSIPKSFMIHQMVSSLGSTEQSCSASILLWPQGNEGIRGLKGDGTQEPVTFSSQLQKEDPLEKPLQFLFVNFFIKQ